MTCTISVENVLEHVINRSSELKGYIYCPEFDGSLLDRGFGSAYFVATPSLYLEP